MRNASYQEDQCSEIVPVTKIQAGGLLQEYETVPEDDRIGNDQGEYLEGENVLK